MPGTRHILATVCMLLLAGSGVANAQSDGDAEAGSARPDASPELVLGGGFNDVAIAVDRDGNRHLVTSETVATQDMLDAGKEPSGDLWYVTDRGGSWSTSRLLEGDPPRFDWSGATVATDDDGSVHIAAVNGCSGCTPGGSEGIYHLTDKDRAPGDFGEPVRVAPRNTTGPSLAVVDGIIHLAFSKLSLPGDPPPPAPVFYRTDVTGSWVTHRLAERGYQAELRVGPDGRVHIVYIGDATKGFDSEVQYVEVAADGGQPSRPVRLPGSRGLPYTPSLALDPDGRPQVAWDTTGDIAWTRLTEDGWSRPEAIGVKRVDSHSLTIDEDGQPHVVLVGRLDPGRGVIHAQRGAGDWPRSVVAPGVTWSPVASAMVGPDITVAWTRSFDEPIGLWSYGPAPAAVPVAGPENVALRELLSGTTVAGCEAFTEQGENDPFSYGAVAAISCDDPARRVRQLALFRFPDPDSMAGYWDWRLAQVDPALPSRDGACADGRRGHDRWEHGELFCYVSRQSREAKLRWTDERTGTYGILDATGRDIGGLHRAWLGLRGDPGEA